MERSKRDQKRSRAITEIVFEIGYEKWRSLSIAQKNKKIKIKISEFKKQAKKGREYMKTLNKEYRGYM